MTRRIRTMFAVAAIATCSIGANAQVLNYSQNAGWFSGATDAIPGAQQATMLPPNNFPPGGGLDFYSAVGVFAPLQTWKTIGWGCPDLVATANCARGGATSSPFGFPVADPFLTAGRSALQVIGSFGTLNINTWQDVTTINHRNQPIGGNVLNTVQVQSFLRLNGSGLNDGSGPCIDGLDASCGTPSFTNVTFVETDNHNGNVALCNLSPGGNAPVNPLGSACDDFALVSGLDLATLPLPANSPWNPFNQMLFVNFRLFAVAGSGAIVCDGSATQPLACAGYNGVINGKDTIVVYTAEGSTNSFTIQAQLSPFPARLFAQFVIGDCEYDQKALKKNQAPPPDNNLREVGDVVNFWGSQWWKNNCMSLFVDKGYPAFKGFATNISNVPTPTGPCGTWQARPGNSGHPPATLPQVVEIIVTDNVIKDGPNISGNIKQIVRVDRSQPPGLDNYAGNPGHQGWGTITNIDCGVNPGNVP